MKPGPKPKDKTFSTPLQGIPEPPKGIGLLAANHWRELTANIDEAGLLSLLDFDALHIYITNWSRWREAQAKIAEQGAVIEARNGYQQPNPWWTIADKCETNMRPYLDMFGMSPKSRSKLTVKEPEVIDPKWAVFGN